MLAPDRCTRVSPFIAVLLLCVVAVCGYPQIPNTPTPEELYGAWFVRLLKVDELCLEMNTWEKVRVCGIFVVTNAVA